MGRGNLWKWSLAVGIGDPWVDQRGQHTVKIRHCSILARELVDTTRFEWSCGDRTEKTAGKKEEGGKSREANWSGKHSAVLPSQASTGQLKDPVYAKFCLIVEGLRQNMEKSPESLDLLQVWKGICTHGKPVRGLWGAGGNDQMLFDRKGHWDYGLRRHRKWQKPYHAGPRIIRLRGYPMENNQASLQGNWKAGSPNWEAWNLHWNQRYLQGRKSQFVFQIAEHWPQNPGKQETDSSHRGLRERGNQTRLSLCWS